MFLFVAVGAVLLLGKLLFGVFGWPLAAIGAGFCVIGLVEASRPKIFRLVINDGFIAWGDAASLQQLQRSEIATVKMEHGDGRVMELRKKDGTSIFIKETYFRYPDRIYNWIRSNWPEVAVVM
jgi:hypothetical protein